MTTRASESEVLEESDRRPRWRVVDILVASVVAVAGGAVFAVWNTAAAPLMNAMVPPLSAFYVGVWLFPGVLGALIVRKPGAAVYTELVAATVEALIGSSWGFSTVYYGLLEGLGAEVVFLVFLYRRWGVTVAALAGAGAGVAAGLLDVFVYYPTITAAAKLGYVGLTIVSGLVVAGLASWLLVRALARTGVLASFASGRDAERV
ncbi:ECF transporter S component [Spongisporangium articulatum]|uniref:ECF transporter S component n=1 Tax=Spongisporangium articulatum TaxID=3362603 RepID=A0ABW8AI24_9ACTN